MNSPNPFGQGMFLRCVEPERRLVGGHMGWAIHRFAIKGGITPMQAFSRTFAEGIARPSFLSRMVKAGVIEEVTP